LLDSAVAGTTTISADADITLTTTTGLANESREAILLWTAGGTVTRNITAPAQSKVYIVINKSSNTQSIVLRGVGPTTGVTIVLNEKAVCAWNGSDFVKVSSTVITNLTGTLPVANGGTGVTTSTGTGNVVLSANPTLTGTPLAPTASSGTSTTQIATTAFATTGIQALYPVGSIYINASVATNPATLIGFGTWTAFGAGRVMMGSGNASYLIGTTGGSADAVVPTHTHTYSSTSGSTDLSHTHTIGGASNGSGGGADSNQVLLANFSSSNNKTSSGASVSMTHTHTVSGTTDSTGVSPTGANLQPYIVVYMWQRTA
jgi:hypothetical protein